MKYCLLLLALVAYAYGVDYCNLSCGNQHTMCAYTAENKCSNLIKSGLSQDEKQRVVKLHNDLRQKVARGEESQGVGGKPQPAAKFMATLTWDNELATIAQRWADQCQFAHDSCRETLNGVVGQNVAYVASSGAIGTLSVESLVQSWYNEVKDFNADLISQPFTSLKSSNNKQIGHYTQFVWAKTNKIGCGAVKYIESGMNKFILYCNYAPAGNFVNQYIYEAADGSSSGADSVSKSSSSQVPQSSKKASSQPPQGSSSSPSIPYPLSSFPGKLSPSSYNNQAQQPNRVYPSGFKPNNFDDSASSYYVTVNGRTQQVSKNQFDALPQQFSSFNRFYSY